MQSQAPVGPSRDTGLPPGVEVGPLGGRVAAFVIDSIVPAVLVTVLSFLAPGLSGGARVVISIVLVLLGLAWAGLVAVMTGSRAASPGMRVLKLQLVGFYDGRPVGLPRVVLRGLMFWALFVTGVGLVIMLALLVVHPRHQGWHDRLAEAVMIKARMLAPSSSAAPNGSPASLNPTVPTYPPEQHQPSPYAPEQHQPETYPPEQYTPEQYTPEPSAPPLYAAERYAKPPQIVPPLPPSPDEEVEEVDDATRMQTPVESSGWAAVLDDGRRVAVDGLVLLGRNPQPQPGEEDAELVKLADETRTVSKSHLAIGLDAAGIYVVDRGSTNGSTVTNPGGGSTRCRVSEPVYVGEDTIVSMGDHWLRIERTDG